MLHKNNDGKKQSSEDPRDDSQDKQTGEADGSERDGRQQEGQDEVPSPQFRRSAWTSWIFLGLMLLFFLYFWPGGGFSTQPQISYSTFKKELREGNIKRVVAEGENLRGEFKEPIVPPASKEEPEESPDGDSPSGRQAEPNGQQTIADRVEEEQEEEGPPQISEFRTKTPPFGDDQLTQQLEKHNVELVSKGSGESMLWLGLLNILPFLLLIGIGILVMRRMSAQTGGLMNISRSRAKEFHKEEAGVTFKDVAGAKEAKEDLKEIIGFLKRPGDYTELGCRVPKGVLLVGPPGTGKTLLARAVAGEADVPFFSISGSDFMEMFVGVGASRVRDLFKKAKDSAPCIIFLDELDSVGRRRGAGLGGGHDEREQTLNQLLSEIDGFEQNENVVVMAATNRPDILDPALLRTGRFDRRVVIDMPTLEERIEILEVHTRKVPLEDDVDLEGFARALPGASGADLNNLVNEAALLAAKRGKKKVSNDEFSASRDKVIMGQKRGSVKLKEEERHAIAIHESGHALVAHLLPDADPVEKVSIIPRGRGLGATQQLPEERYNYNVEYLKGRIKVMLGGRAAENVVLGTFSTGAADDLTQATRLARKMVSQWGMSDKFSHVAFEESDHQVFLGEQLTQHREYSEETAREIDLEVKALIDACYEDVANLLEEHKGRLERLAANLEEHEVLEGDVLDRALDGEFHTAKEARASN